jgi:hypothetical protein
MDNINTTFFLDFSKSINFLKNLKKKYDDDKYWNNDLYQISNYKELIGIMPYFFIDKDIDLIDYEKYNYSDLEKIPWHYDFNIYEKILNKNKYINENDLWNNYNYTKKYINSNNEENKYYKPNIELLKKFIPIGYLIPPMDNENISVIKKNKKNNNTTYEPVTETFVNKIEGFANYDIDIDNNENIIVNSIDNNGLYKKITTIGILLLLFFIIVILIIISINSFL